MSEPVFIRVVLPYHLRNLALVGGELSLKLADERLTLGGILDEIEARYPALRGTIRDHGTLRRRPFVRFYACQEDLSHEPADTPLPQPVIDGSEPFLIVGAMAGG